MGFSKAFNFIPHDILTTKLDAYGFNRNLVRYIHSYLKKKQCVLINSTTSSFKHILPVVPQGSTIRPTLFNLFLMIFSFVF